VTQTTSIPCAHARRACVGNHVEVVAHRGELAFRVRHFSRVSPFEISKAARRQLPNRTTTQ
jgi:hypothetical protein